MEKCKFYILQKSIQKNVVLLVKKKHYRDFPGGPVVKTLPSNAGGGGLILGQGTKIPHALQPKKQNLKQQKQYCNKFDKDLSTSHTHTHKQQQKKETLKTLGNKYKLFFIRFGFRKPCVNQSSEFCFM